MKNLKNKNVLVYGLSVSGVWCAKLLLKKKAHIFLFDDNQEKLKGVGIKNCEILLSLDKSLIKNMNLIVVSPSIEPDNSVFLLAKECSVKVMSELEFASQFCPNLVAVTGTNGKTTTVELITAILNKKQKAVACGNIGYPLSKAVLNNKRSIKVAEVSSFMLENAQTFNPKVATVLNIEEDHLIRHKTMEEYVKLKMNIFKNLSATDFAVVNLDLNINPQTNAEVVSYSYSHPAHVKVKDGAIYLLGTKIVNLNELKLKGKHNIYNVMCAICYGYIYNIKPAKMREALINFTPDRFRNEFVAVVGGIKFVNDSKSTNIASTLASTESCKGAIVLLLGGSKKELNYSVLFNKLTKRVKHIVAFGEIAEDIVLANNNKFKIDICENLSSAFDFALTVAIKNDTILLSPSSASYDEFSNYIERGKKFNEKVKEYEAKISKT